MARTDAVSVETFIAALDHPLKQEILALRRLLLAVDPSIGEQVKWNAPSFHTGEHFATMQLRKPDAVRLILHLGAKARKQPALVIVDPEGLLTWLGPDRALLEFHDAAELAGGSEALTAIVRQWIAHV
ncbi:DUF1801 domain-containing protein [Stenotrophomonas sp. SY1]|jgi:hypothetical protein|uniref:DUF1801 domain-containing protein n=1 Tax=Stenotrophomonas sp. SY1 TaxID=477235 RepID=UPI001E41E41E|nr:DUF1801 domain-containing protein [Stenotrophomonas sp. SY1]MCD9087773.1 DUF1801 domain-containing protein [Stenotrophomonas sp. SY1]